MIEVALQIVSNLFIALIIGILIGYTIGKSNFSKLFEIQKNLTNIKTKDNLKKIKGIDSKIEFELNRMGINSFKQISKWTNEDSIRIGSLINSEKSIQEFSWVEQAKILSSGSETIYSRKVENKEVDIA